MSRKTPNEMCSVSLKTYSRKGQLVGGVGGRYSPVREDTMGLHKSLEQVDSRTGHAGPYVVGPLIRKTKGKINKLITPQGERQPVAVGGKKAEGIQCTGKGGRKHPLKENRSVFKNPPR